MIELYGFVSVTAMVVFYALESRSNVFVLAFSASCVSSALYAALIGSWPFAAVESVWAMVAFARWRRVRIAAEGALG